MDSAPAPGSVPANDLTEAHARLAGILRASLDCVVTVDHLGRVLEFNPAAETTFGYRAADVLGRPMAELIVPPEFRARHEAGMQQQLETGKASMLGRRMEMVAMRADGTRFPCELTITRLQLDGHPVFTAFLRDITERKNTEDQLKRLNTDLEREVALRTAEMRSAVFAAERVRNRLERAQAIAHLGDVEAHPGTKVRIWSKETFRLYGMEPADTAPTLEEVLARVHPEDVPRVRDAVLRSLDGSLKEAQLDYRVIRPDGSTRWLRIVAESDIDPLTKQKRITSTIRDITEQRAAEQELELALERERELGKLKADFLHMITHEYRTPLGIITSSADILDRYLDRLSPDDRKDHLQSIRGAARRLAGLVEEVLFLGKAEAGRVPLDLREHDPVVLARSVVAEVSAALGTEREIRYETTYAPPRAWLDEKLLRHVLTNLVSNACKYSTLDRPVHIAVRLDDGQLVYVVRDHGIGIPAADLPRIFEMFHRAGNVGTISGTGLGLVVVRRCLDLLGGRIEIASTVGEGTSVTVRLPWRPPPVPAR